MSFPVQQQPLEPQKREHTASAPVRFQGHSIITSAYTPAARAATSPPPVQNPSLPSSMTATSAAASSPKLLSRAAPSQSRPIIAFFSQPNPSHTRFNELADRLKEQDNWKEDLTKQVQATPDFNLDSIRNDRLRGYDREVLKVMLEAVKAKTSDPATLQALDDKLKHCDVLVVQVSEDKLKHLGGGAVNAVYLVTYLDADGVERQGVFKPDPVDLSKTTQLKESFFGTAQASGIPPGSEGHLTERSVASSVLDKRLYPQENISVNTRYAVVNGQRGIMMDKAVGKSPKTGETVREFITEDMIRKTPAAQAFYVRNQPLSASNLRTLAHLMHYRSIEIKNGQLYGTRLELTQLNPNNPKTAEGLLRLQVFDWITGQVDRHPQNYFIADDGTVAAIDNDCSFGVNAVPEGVDVRKQPSLMFVIPNNASLMLRLTPVVTQDVKKEIDALHQNRAELARDLSHYLSPKEVAATLTRLEKIHAHVNSGQCLKVDQANDLLSEAAQRKIDPNNSLLARETQAYNSSEKGWNHLRALYR